MIDVFYLPISKNFESNNINPKLLSSDLKFKVIRSRPSIYSMICCVILTKLM